MNRWPWCAIDNVLVREEVCCPCGCEADKLREIIEKVPVVKVLPNNWTGKDHDKE